MRKDTDVFADNTVAKNEKGSKQQGAGERPLPGEKVFKQKGKSHQPGYTNIPGAGPNPEK